MEEWWHHQLSRYILLLPIATGPLLVPSSSTIMDILWASTAMNVAQSTLCLRPSIAVSVELNEYDNIVILNFCS